MTRIPVSLGAFAHRGRVLAAAALAAPALSGRGGEEPGGSGSPAGPGGSAGSGAGAASSSP